jgi:predicted nucleic acid-binding protein
VIVVDASALLEVLLRTPRSQMIESRLFGASEPLHAPHLIDLEVAQVIRRFTLAREIGTGRAQAAVADLLNLPINRHAHDLLLPRVWALRDNFSAYDGAYVALAETLGATLVTHDRRLATVARRHVSVEVV